MEQNESRAKFHIIMQGTTEKDEEIVMSKMIDKKQMKMSNRDRTLSNKIFNCRCIWSGCCILSQQNWRHGFKVPLKDIDKSISRS